MANAITILRKLDHPALLAWSYREMARQEDAKVALKHLQSSIELYERADESVELAITYGHLGDLLGDMKRIGDAATRTGRVSVPWKTRFDRAQHVR